MGRVEVRYCSRTKAGNTRRIAEAIAEGAATKAVSIDDEPKLTEKADILFLGGAPYANIMAQSSSSMLRHLILGEFSGILPSFS